MAAILEETVVANVAKINEDLKQTKAQIRTKHDDRIARLIRAKGFDRAFADMMNSKRIGWIEAQAWTRAAVRYSK